MRSRTAGRFASLVASISFYSFLNRAKIIKSQLGTFKDCLEARVFDFTEDDSQEACDYRLLARNFFCKITNRRP